MLNMVLTFGCKGRQCESVTGQPLCGVFRFQNAIGLKSLRRRKREMIPSQETYPMSECKASRIGLSIRTERGNICRRISTFGKQVDFFIPK